VLDRYVNMDYILLDGITGQSVGRITCTYDIWCKYCKHLHARVQDFPPDMRADFENMDVRGYAGMFHLPAHGPECRTKYNLNYAKGGAHTDGEGQERVWAAQGLIAVQTSEMGPGNRHGTMDDHTGDHNFSRFLGFSTENSCSGAQSLADRPAAEKLMPKRLVDAIRLGPIHRETADGIAANYSEHVKEWREKLTAFENDPENAEDPYEEPDMGESS
jgi:hypothetical protein